MSTLASHAAENRAVRSVQLQDSDGESKPEAVRNRAPAGPASSREANVGHSEGERSDDGAETERETEAAAEAAAAAVEKAGREV